MINKKKKWSGEIVLVKGLLDYKFENFGLNFNNAREDFLIKLSKGEKAIDYNNLFLEIDDTVIRSYDFLKQVGTLYDILINLLNEDEAVIDSSNMQIDLLKIITSLRDIIFTKIDNITDQTEEKKKKIFAAQLDVINNSKTSLEKRNELNDQYAKRNIITKIINFLTHLERLKRVYQKNQNKNLINQILSG